ncbi:hypothetical protein JRO89_XS03G0282000 [Xanthoceras sorbifolium]|uniref:Phosphorylated adapter RNA export protein n=1 Tax=Xanthoceras sorbifolium TaxID=99658 RepID=A0ABQ8IDJ9_9ROSI|nr:hypothetical protein JRO89_XS03G0282000 [Xanthoceras sorbifolium]
MDEGESILGAIYEDDNLEDAEDVDMLDVEEGEFVEHNSRSQTNLGQNSGGDVDVGNQESQNKTRKRRANKKKNRKKKNGSGQNFTNINRFVLDTCKRLKEKKSYMVYTAVGCLGVSALSDLVKEHYAAVNPESMILINLTFSSICVDAIQSCGGQMTTDGKRCRTGGGILWNIIKARAPGAYKEIMKKTKEFEIMILYVILQKQFRQPNKKQAPEQIKEDSQRVVCALSDGIQASIPDSSQFVPENQQEQSSAEGNRKSVHERIRVPVSYDDLLGEEPKNDSA